MSDVISRLNVALHGRYRVERPLGEGGMATVYLADDLKHERRVALKVLKPELAAAVGAERFLAEIKTTANLQHPHILPLFDSGEAAGFLFYVMPWVEGESLREKLDREHQLAVDEAVRIATKVAAALQAAHERGVIHRDIKPANILLANGEPLVSDFGIALAVSRGGGGRLTETGMSVGTPHYMSPEQATGDSRVGPATDLYALGCVLFEMLVGEPPHTGSTPQAILAKIIMSEPVSASAHRRTVPPNVEATIKRALERLPADRFGSAAEFLRALTEPTYRYGGVVDGAGSHGPWKKISMGLAASTAALALVAVWSASALLGPERAAVARFDVTPATEGQLLAASAQGVRAVPSPDGSWFVYVGEAPGGGKQLWRRTLDDLVAVALPGTEGANAPVVSPDGSSVAFVTDDLAIRIVSLQGGPPFTVVASGGPFDWGSDGMIYFARDGIIHRVLATGGEATPFTAPVENVVPRNLDALPDGRGLLMTLFVGTPAQARIAAVGPEGGEVREILAGTMARYAESGHIVHATAAGTLMAAPFDVRRLELTGPSVPLLEGVAVDNTARAQFALSQSGTLLYGIGAGSASELVWVSRDGRVEPVDETWTGEFGSPSLSPDGTRVTVAIQGATSMDIWVKLLDRGPSTRLTLDGGRSDYPIWTPDGGSVTFTSDRAGPSFDLWTKRADGSAEPVLELDEEWALAEAAWSPDGAWFIHRTSSNLRGAGDILGHPHPRTAAPVPLVASSFTELAPMVSPDGRWMAYSSNETGRSEVFVVPFPNTRDARWSVSVGGGSEPLWSRDGREIFYRNGQGDVMAVAVRADPGFSVGTPSVLFPGADYQRNIVHRQYDVAPDGERFIMVRRVGAGQQSRLVLVQGFFEELARIAPS
ncbi:MAG: protein kinase [Longimicrobiales bacterium]